LYQFHNVFKVSFFYYTFFRFEATIEKTLLNNNEINNKSKLNIRNEIDQIKTYFHLCRSFVHQLGFLSWEKRQSFNILRKTSQLLRELKSLDDQTW
jgi:hypothetical protein